MIEVFGENYYLDLDAIDAFLNLNTEKKDEENDAQQISVIKYELVKLLADVVMSDAEQIDEKLGSRGSNQLGIPFKLAWNTMLKYKLLRKL